MPGTIKMPPKDHPFRDAAIRLEPAVRAVFYDGHVPLFVPQAKAQATRAYDQNADLKGPVELLALRAEDDMLVLVTVSKRGKVRAEWDFGVLAS